MEGRAPVVLKRAEHPISRRDIDPDALKVLYRLYRNGFKAYLVGGAVRDLLMGKRPKDFDVVTDARPGQVKNLRQLHAHRPPVQACTHTVQGREDH